MTGKVKKKRKRKAKKRQVSKPRGPLGGPRVPSRVAYRRPKKTTRESARWYEMQSAFLAEGVEPEFIKRIADAHYSLAVPDHVMRYVCGR